jgi:hypothetical protein
VTTSLPRSAYLAAVADARSSRDGAPLSATERRDRVLAISCLLRDIAERGWPEAPSRRLVFRGDVPKRPRPLPRNWHYPARSGCSGVNPSELTS